MGQLPPTCSGALDAERAEARATVVAALSSDRYLALLDRLEQASGAARQGTRSRRSATSGGRSGGEPGRPSRGSTARRATRISTQGGSARNGPATRQSSRPTSSGSEGKTFVAAAKELQDVLGEHQDAVVAEARIRAWAARRRRRAMPSAPPREEHERMEGPGRRGRARGSRCAARRSRSRERRPCGGRRPRPRDAERAPGARHPPPAVRRLELPEGKVRAGGERRGLRDPRGGGGDRPSLLARGRAAVDVLHDAKDRPKRVRYWRLRIVGGEPPLRPRGRRGALGLGGRSRIAAQLRARPRRCSARRSVGPCSTDDGGGPVAPDSRAAPVFRNGRRRAGMDEPMRSHLFRLRLGILLIVLSWFPFAQILIAVAQDNGHLTSDKSALVVRRRLGDPDPCRPRGVAAGRETGSRGGQAGGLAAHAETPVALVLAGIGGSLSRGEH